MPDACFSTLPQKQFFMSPMTLMKQMPADYIGTMADVQKHHGDLVHLKAFGGTMHLAFISDPETNREVFIRHNDKLAKSPSQIQTFLYAAGNSVATAHGADWKAKRQEANHLFSRQTVAALGGAQVDAASDFLISLGTAPLEGRDLAKRLSAATTGRAILGRPVTEEEASQMLRLSDAMRDRFNAESRHLFARPNWVLAPWRRRLTQQKKLVQPLIERAITAARQDTGQNDGLMHHYVNGDFLTSNDTEVLTLMTGLLVGALDNIAAGVAWWLAMVAHHPDVQAAVAAEVRENLGTDPATPAALQNCALLQASIQETLRMRPPAQANQPRMLAKPMPIAGTTLPKNTFVFNSIYNIHHDPRWFENPEQFDPTRFTKGGAAKSLGYLPFGHGPRNCVAQGMAMQQMAAIGAAILRDYAVTTQGTALPVNEQNPFLVPAKFDLQINPLK